MAVRSAKLSVLLIRSWIEDVRAIRTALATAGLDAEITIVDFEASLNAALMRGGHDVVIFDASTPGLAHDVVTACMRANRRGAPLVALGDVRTLGERVVAALAVHAN